MQDMRDKDSYKKLGLEYLRKKSATKLNAKPLEFFAIAVKESMAQREKKDLLLSLQSPL